MSLFDVAPRPLVCSPEDEERFTRYLDYDGPDRGRPAAPGRCWEWTGYRHASGYGVFSLRTGSVKAHRAAYWIFNGPFPLAHQIDHKCRNTSCVNPAHLEPVTDSENQRRRRHAVQATLLQEAQAKGYA